jgi:tetratricopeptide (TPR) repeat protein
VSHFVKLVAVLAFVNVQTLGRPKDIALHLGDELFKAGNYFSAITEYKRFLYFNKDDSSISYTYSQIGLAYRNQSLWDNAIDAFRKSASEARNDSIRDEERINIGVTLLARRDYVGGELVLSRVSYFSKRPSIIKKANFYLGISYLYEFQWQEARIIFKEYFDSTDIIALYYAAWIGSNICW